MNKAEWTFFKKVDCEFDVSITLRIDYLSNTYNIDQVNFPYIMCDWLEWERKTDITDQVLEAINEANVFAKNELCNECKE